MARRKIKASSNLLQFFGKGLKESQRSSISDEAEGYLSVPFREHHKLTGRSSFNSKAINLMVMLSSPFLVQRIPITFRDKDSIHQHSYHLNLIP